MKKIGFLLLAVFLTGVTVTQAQKKQYAIYAVAFYNLENLFDTVHDAGKNDHEFLPDGSYQWTAKKYESKLQNLSKVLGSLSRDLVPEGPAFIGVAEAENSRVLEDLVKQPAISNYEFVHYEGPDRRGIDCALLYDPKQFSVTHSKLVLSTPFEWDKALKDSLMRSAKKLKLIVMGDMNDDPMDESMEVLGARKYPKQVKKGEFYNPWWETLEDKGVGTLLYRGKWNLFDQIVISKPLLKAKKGLRYDHNEVFIRDYLIQQDGKYKGSPLRTHGGRTWLNGYSDHLPTIIYLKN